MGCGPSEVTPNNSHTQNNNHAQSNSYTHFSKENTNIKKEGSPSSSNALISTRRGVPLPPRISVTMAPDLAQLDVVPTTPVENPTLSGYIYVPPPIPILIYQDGDAFTTCYLTVRGESLVFECLNGEFDQTPYAFDMYQYASKSADLGTTVTLVHRQSGQCVASSSDGIATLMNFPDWMSQDNDEIELNPMFFLRTQESQDSDYTLFRCHSGPAKYLARDTETNKAYMSPWVRYPSFLQLKVVTDRSSHETAANEYMIGGF